MVYICSRTYRMSVSIYHSSFHTCKRFFELFTNITNNTAIVFNTYGIEVKCSNPKIKINSILDESSFTKYTCDEKIILAISIRSINNIWKKHTTNTPIRILYSGQNTILFIINNNSTYSIPCTIIDDSAYIDRIHMFDDVDYQVEFEISPSFLYSFIKKNHKTSTTDKPIHSIHFKSDVKNQDIYIQHMRLPASKQTERYHFITTIQESYIFNYINQIIKNNSKQKIKTLLVGLYTHKSMKILSYVDSCSYIEYYIPPIKQN